MRRGKGSTKVEWKAGPLAGVAPHRVRGSGANRDEMSQTEVACQ